MSKPPPTFYVFHGADEFTRAETLTDFKRRLGPPDTVDLNTTLLDGRNLTLAELRYACDAIPFLAEKRLVIVKGLLTRLTPRKGQELSTAQKEYLAALTDYLPRLPETTRLVFVEDGPLPAKHPILQLAQREERGYVKRFDPPGYVKRFDPPDAKALPRWIAKRVRRHGGEIEPQAARQLAALVGADLGGEIEPQATRQLAALVGADLRLLDQEIAKLVTYTNAKRAPVPAPHSGQGTEGAGVLLAGHRPGAQIASLPGAQTPQPGDPLHRCAIGEGVSPPAGHRRGHQERGDRGGGGA